MVETPVTLSSRYKSRPLQLEAIIWEKEIDKIIQQSINLPILASEVGLVAKLYLLWQNLKQESSIGLQLFGMRFYSVSSNDQLSSLKQYQIVGLTLTNVIIPWILTKRNFHRAASFYKIASIVNFLLFLRNGKFRKVEERILGVCCGATTERKTVYTDPSQYDLMNQELLRETLAEFLTFAIPILNLQRVKRFAANALASLWPYSSHESQMTSIDDRTNDDFTICAICKNSPVTPYEIGCRHIFCYYCLYSNQLADNNLFSCVSCGYKSSPEDFKYSIKSIMSKHVDQ